MERKEYKKPKYMIEIDLSPYCIDDCDHGIWRGADYLVAEGNTLDELLENATVSWSDQDGGEAGESEADSEFYQDLIKAEFRFLNTLTQNGKFKNVCIPFFRSKSVFNNLKVNKKS